MKVLSKYLILCADETCFSKVYAVKLSYFYFVKGSSVPKIFDCGTYDSIGSVLIFLKNYADFFLVLNKAKRFQMVLFKLFIRFRITFRWALALFGITFPLYDDIHCAVPDIQ